MSDVGNVDDSPVVRFTNKVLLDALGKRAHAIRYRRYPSRTDPRGRVVVGFRVGEEWQEALVPSILRWGKLINRLKVMSRMVDYGPNVSTDGTIVLRVSESRTARFRLTSNPRPGDDELLIEVEADWAAGDSAGMET